jgi:uncharacterized membrane protein (GlpM family)
LIVRAKWSTLRETHWDEYATRFVFGGLVTLLAGLVADRFGPAIGGLFLAFPAIFPASASLIQRQQKEKKQKQRMDGTQRGRLAAGVDATGAAIGTCGLAAFAVTAHLLLQVVPLWLALAAATVIWGIVSVGIWFIWRKFRTRLSAKNS